MINYLTGKPLFEVDGALVLDVRDVGYRVRMTDASLAWALVQDSISLFIHSIIREDVFDLYGFETKKELYFFKKLLAVAGVGPKSALAMIGMASPDTLYQAIVKDNIAFLTSVPGIGKKTAERMCIELRDKLKDYQVESGFEMAEDDRDVIDALVALGYSAGQAHAAITKIEEGITDVNGRIKSALNHIH